MSKVKTTIKAELDESAVILKTISDNMAELIEAAAELVIRTCRSGKKVLFIGNGGSAADAQHLATEFIGRFLRERKPLPGLALTTDTSVLTAIANDYGYEKVFSRQIEALGTEGDILVAMTTSGTSVSILEALDTARTAGIQTLLLTGERGTSLKSKADITIIVPSTISPRIQEAHITIGHIICGLVERELFSDHLTPNGKGR